MWHFSWQSVQYPVYHVECWAKKALILCRSSFFTLSGTRAEKQRQHYLKSSGGNLLMYL